LAATELPKRQFRCSRSAAKPTPVRSSAHPLLLSQQHGVQRDGLGRRLRRHDRVALDVQQLGDLTSHHHRDAVERRPEQGRPDDTTRNRRGRFGEQVGLLDLHRGPSASRHRNDPQTPAAHVLDVNEHDSRDRASERLYIGLSQATDQLIVVGDPHAVRRMGGPGVVLLGDVAGDRR
jgi:hypothetical protein